MTPKARAAFEIYRGLGPARTTKEAAALVGTTQRTLQGWSSKYEWVRLCTEHDHAELREALGKREIIRERGTQQLIDAIPKAVKVLMDIMEDERELPILDRQGNHQKDADGEFMFKPLVKASTRANCAEKILGIAGLVPVKRMETIDRTAESLDEAAAITRAMTPAQLEALIKILGDDD